MEFDDSTLIETVKEKVRSDLGISSGTVITFFFKKEELSEGTLSACGIAAAAEGKEQALYEVVIETSATSSSERGGGTLPKSIEVPARGPGQWNDTLCITC